VKRQRSLPAGKTIIFAMKGGFLELIVEGDSLFVMSSLSSSGPHFSELLRAGMYSS